MAGEEYGTSEYATAEQLAYAKLLDFGMKIGLAALLATFAIYVFGLAGPHVPLEQVSQYWSMKVHDYLEGAHVPIGWGWLSLAGTGDFMNFLPIAFLSAVTIFCYLRILPMLLAAGDKIYAAIAVLEVLVLVLAASGILAVGH
jgi:hypothetical protein